MNTTKDQPAPRFSEEHKRRIGVAMRQVQNDRNALVAEGRAAREARAAGQAETQKEVFNLAREVARGELSAAEALPRAEGAAVMVRLAMADDDRTAFETWLQVLRQQAAEEERALVRRGAAQAAEAR